MERIGKPPAPKLADYDELIKTGQVYILRRTADDKVVGFIVLTDDEERSSIQVNNLVVDPGEQGKGYGRILMNHAEDLVRLRKRGALTLYTNAKMHENLVRYPKMGFFETGRRVEDGYERVYYRKSIS